MAACPRTTQPRRRNSSPSLGAAYLDVLRRLCTQHGANAVHHDRPSCNPLYHWMHHLCSLFAPQASPAADAAEAEAGVMDYVMRRSRGSREQIPSWWPQVRHARQYRQAGRQGHRQAVWLRVRLFDYFDVACHTAAAWHSTSAGWPHTVYAGAAGQGPAMRPLLMCTIMHMPQTRSHACSLCQHTP